MQYEISMLVLEKSNPGQLLSTKSLLCWTGLAQKQIVLASEIPKNCSCDRLFSDLLSRNCFRRLGSEWEFPLDCNDWIKLIKPYTTSYTTSWWNYITSHCSLSSALYATFICQVKWGGSLREKFFLCMNEFVCVIYRLEFIFQWFSRADYACALRFSFPHPEGWDGVSDLCAVIGCPWRGCQWQNEVFALDQMFDLCFPETNPLDPYCLVITMRDWFL